MVTCRRWGQTPINEKQRDRASSAAVFIYLTTGTVVPHASSSLQTEDSPRRQPAAPVTRCVAWASTASRESKEDQAPAAGGTGEERGKGRVNSVLTEIRRRTGSVTDIISVDTGWPT